MTTENEYTPPQTLMERMAAVELRLAVIEKVMRQAFGERWMDRIFKQAGEHGDTG